MTETHMQNMKFIEGTITKSGKSALVRPLHRFASDKPGFVVTYKDRFAGPARTLRITLDREGGECVRVGFLDWIWAKRPWNGEAGSRDYSINFEK